MHPAAVRAEAIELVSQGLSDCEVARRVGVPRTGGGAWRRARGRRPPPLCPRCWRPAKDFDWSPERYAELLGFYLGDGCIVQAGRTYRLRVSLDMKYPAVICRIHGLLAATFMGNY